jgi:hypothetical protein
MGAGRLTVRDVFEVVGILTLLIGIAMIHVPAAVIVAGVLTVAAFEVRGG